MYIIISYDVPANRTNVFKKICRRFLPHRQNSLFSGNLSRSLFEKLKREILNNLKEGDRVIVWKIADGTIFSEEEYGESKYSLGDDII